jgi:hypothetical protein
MRFVSARLALATLILGALPAWLPAQVDMDGARSLVGRSQHDLSSISNVAAMSAKEKERYDNALRHLSEFDQGLAHARFDKGKLDTAIDDIDNVCKNNTLVPGERDVLLGDLRELRRLREDRKD